MRIPLISSCETLWWCEGGGSGQVSLTIEGVTQPSFSQGWIRIEVFLESFFNLMAFALPGFSVLLKKSFTNVADMLE